MKNLARQVLLTVSVAMLGGCQVFAPTQFARMQSDAAEAGKQNPGRAVSALDQGRGHLRAQRNGEAITAFNVALMTGENPAAAFNGLGVAYARIGRDDLAYRFFKKAAISDPENPVYARNLAMLMDSPRFTLAAMSRGERQLERPAASALPPPPQQLAATAPARPGTLRREGKGQVSLATIAPQESTGPARASGCNTGSATRATGCKAAPLPVVASRNSATRRPVVATAVADKPSSPQEALPVPAAKAQRKTIDIAPANSTPARGSDKARTAARSTAAS